HNRLKVDNSSDLTAGRTGAMDTSTITGLGMGGSGIHYAHIQDLEIDLGQGGDVPIKSGTVHIGDTFNVYGTRKGTPTKVVGGAGNDTINVGGDTGGGNLDHIQGPLTVIGGGGRDTL